MRTPILDGPGPATSAGGIHVRTRAPTWEEEAVVRIERGTHGHEAYETTVGGTLIQDTLAGRFSAYTLHGSGAVRNVTSGRDVNGEHRDGVRGQLLWTPSEALRARLLLERELVDDDCCAYLPIRYSPATLGRAAALGHRLLPPDVHARKVAQDGSNRRRITHEAATLQFELGLPEETRLIGITGWRHWRFDARSDLDGIDLAIAPRGGAHMNHRQWSQELRLEGRLAPRLDYSVGAYHLDRSHRREGSLTYGPDAARWFTALMDLPPLDDALLAAVLDGATVRGPGTQSATTQSLFGQLDWGARDDFRLTGVVRYSRERVRGTTRRQVSALRPLPPIPGFSELAGRLRDALLGHDALSRHDSRDDSLDGSLRAHLEPRPGIRLEAGVSSGYKPGGINAETVSGGVSPTFDAERSLSLETSVELALPRRGHLRLTFFRTEIRDYQALTYNPDSSPLIPTMNNITNVDAVRSQGVEVESEMALGERTRLALGAGYNDARYTDFRNAPCPPGSGVLYCDFGGKQMANAPRWTALADLRHHRPLANGSEVYGGIAWRWRSGFYGTTERGQGSHVAARGLIDAYIGLRQSHWDLALWAYNLTDEKHITAVLALNGSGDYGALADRPRTIGLSLTLAL
ncbi:MAG: TonB-dependent receptor [Azoarcus sp.]|nr:TonB-dependent receptor [Azoarcus sp.]